MLNFSNNTFDTNLSSTVNYSDYSSANYADYNDTNLRTDAYYSYYDYEDPWPKQDLFYLGIVCIIPVLLGLPAYIMVLYVRQKLFGLDKGFRRFDKCQ